MIKILGEKSSLLNQFIAELRNVEVQNDRMRFRRNLERIGEIFAYEISKGFQSQKIEITTPLGNASATVPNQQVVLGTILRAGLPLHQGFLNYFDNAENAFISAYRKYSKSGDFEIKFEHLSAPNIQGKTLILSDPMLATGSSMLIAYEGLLKKGIPEHTHIVTVVASKEGLRYLRKHMSMSDVTVWAGEVDDELTVKSYIVPGLGDAGDLAYGEK